MLPELIGFNPLSVRSIGNGTRFYATNLAACAKMRNLILHFFLLQIEATGTLIGTFCCRFEPLLHH